MSERHMDLERQSAAELVRAARRAVYRQDFERAAELLDWALLLAPDAPVVERLRIKVLLKEDHLDWAHATIARQMLARPNDASLLILQARCLSQRGEYCRADQVLRRVRAIAPQRREAVEMAAEVAAKLGNHGQAVDLRARLLARHPRDEGAHLSLIDALIETGSRDHGHHAERLLLLLEKPPPALLARSYLMQGRCREAVECLAPHAEALFDQEPSDESDSLLSLYVIALESCGETDRIFALKDWFEMSGCLPQTKLALSRFLLARGRFRAAASMAIRVMRSSAGAHEVSAIPIAAVASALAGRTRLARRLHAWFIESRENPHEHTHTWAECWRRGLLGRTLHEQRSAAGANPGRDPSASVLRSLLCSAVNVHQKRVARDARDSEVSSQAEQDVALCAAALGGV